MCTWRLVPWRMYSVFLNRKPVGGASCRHNHHTESLPLAVENLQTTLILRICGNLFLRSSSCRHKHHLESLPLAVQNMGKTLILMMYHASFDVSAKSLNCGAPKENNGLVLFFLLLFFCWFSTPAEMTEGRAACWDSAASCAVTTARQNRAEIARTVCALSAASSGDNNTSAVNPARL